MNFELTELQGNIGQPCRDFAARELIFNARMWDRKHEWPSNAVKQLGELSLLGIAVPEKWGAGMDNVCYALVMEEISRGCASTGVIMNLEDESGR